MNATESKNDPASFDREEVTHSAGLMSFHEDGEANRYSMIDDGGRWWLALLHNGESTTPRQIANMRRLTAAWNACDGTDTETLEADGPGYLDKLRRRVIALEEAARAAVRALDMMSDDTGRNPRLAAAFNRAIEATGCTAMLSEALRGATQAREPALGQRELSTILAALRTLAAEREETGGDFRYPGIEEIATAGGEFPAMTCEEIDALCQAIETPGRFAGTAAALLDDREVGNRACRSAHLRIRARRDGRRLPDRRDRRHRHARRRTGRVGPRRGRRVVRAPR